MRVRVSSILAFVVAATVSLAAWQSAAPAQAAIGGHCPVAYAAMNKAVKGDPAHTATFNGQTFLFSNADARKMFEAAPSKYAPAYEGFCTTAVSMGMKLESKPTIFAVHEGKTYLFSSDEAKAAFDKDKSGVIAKANANWPKVKQARQTVAAGRTPAAAHAARRSTPSTCATRPGAGRSRCRSRPSNAACASAAFRFARGRAPAAVRRSQGR